MTADLASEIRVEARRKRGKPQLRLDEARRWLAAALQAALTEPGALAGAMTLLMGMRASEVAERVVRDLDDQGRLLWIPHAKTAAGVRRLQVPVVLRPLLLALARGRQPNDPLFEGGTRWWVHYHVTQLCRLAKVPVVGPHSMRGLHATLATASGVTAEHVAASLGHESFEVTARHYADGDVLAAVQARAAGELLASSPPVPQEN
jgi:integrase